MGGPQLPAQPLCCFCKRNIVRAQKPRDGHNRGDIAGRVSQEKKVGEDLLSQGVGSLKSRHATCKLESKADLEIHSTALFTYQE